jgi:predicted dehydrogenase
VTPQPRPLTWNAFNADGGGLLGALGSHYIDGLRYWFGEIASVYGQLHALRPDVLDPATNRVVKAETDDTFSVYRAIRERRHRDDERVVRGDADARGADRRHGGFGHADRGAARA